MGQILLFDSENSTYVIFGLFALLAVAGLVYSYLKRRRKRKIIDSGNFMIARVASISQTGLTVNNIPQMRLVVDIEQAGLQPYRVSIDDYFDLGNMPRPGERIYVAVDPADPKSVVFATLASPGLRTAVRQPDGTDRMMDLGDPELLDLLGISLELRNNSMFRVGNIVDISGTNTAASNVTADIDAIGKPPRRVAFQQIIDGPIPAKGQRVYLLVSKSNPNIVAVAPKSQLKGVVPPEGRMRLFDRTLADEILTDGTKAAATVLTVTSLPPDSPELAAKGITKWDLTVQVKPIGLAPYEAGMIFSLSDQKKVDAIAHVGAEIAVRYDSYHPETISVDTMAMGFPDPRVARQQMLGKG